MKYTKDEAHHEFTRWSKSYDRSILQILLFGPSRRALQKRIEGLGLKAPLILDIGSGTGQFPAVLHDSFPDCHVWALDLVRGMLEGGTARWQALSDRVHPVQADSERLPFPDSFFDVLTCANSFHHYPNQAAAIREMRRVLKPGGVLLLLDGYRDGLWGHFIFDICVATVEGNVHHVSGRKIREMMFDAGFASVDQIRHRGLAPFLLSLARTPDRRLPRAHIFRSRHSVKYDGAEQANGHSAAG